MSNNFDSNFSRKLMRSFLNSVESERCLSKNVDTQLFSGSFKQDTGDIIDVKRPTDFRTVRTPKGDVSGETKSDIITGKASAKVQDYFTAFVDYDEADEAIKMDQLDELLKPLATRMVTDFELDYAKFMMENTGLVAGTVGTPVTSWDHIAEQGAIMQASGIPQDGQWCSAINPFTQRKLASGDRSLGGETSSMTANQRATIAENYAGMKVMTCTTLGSYTTGAGADRTGTLSATPVATYVAAKDSMTQQIAVTGFAANLEVKAGETITVTGRNRLNLSTRKPIVNELGENILFSGTVTTDATLDGSGAGTLIITGPGIFEVNGQYNTVESALASGDVVTLGGSENQLIQPNLFWHKQAFTVASVPIKKLKATDTVATTEDGLQFRVTRDSAFLENVNQVRIDFRPAYGVLNPFFAGQGFGRV